MSSEYAALYESTLQLHARFDRFPPATEAALRVFVEEVGEYLHAVLTGGAPGAVAGEFNDVVVTAIALAQSVGVDRWRLSEAAFAVADKNNAKTPQNGYGVNPKTGKIERGR